MGKVVVAGILVVVMAGLILFSAGVTDTFGLGFSITRGEENTCTEASYDAFVIHATNASDVTGSLTPPEFIRFEQSEGSEKFNRSISENTFTLPSDQWVIIIVRSPDYWNMDLPQQSENLGVSIARISY